ncbi:MAG: signal peptidase I [Oscillospiraceae bacterium]|nr:signal peptidase I [Oscillospiraceae bacterium]
MKSMEQANWLNALLEEADTAELERLLNEVEAPAKNRSLPVPSNAGQLDPSDIIQTTRKPPDWIWEHALPGEYGLSRNPAPVIPAEGEAAPSGHRKKATPLTVASNLLFYVTILFMVGAALLVNMKTNNGRTQIFGYSLFEVETGSMQSVIPVGSLIITKQVESPEIIQVGDVISFTMIDNQIWTHKVIEIVPNFDGRGMLGFRTQGTDNPDPDPDLVAAVNVVGKVERSIPGLGYTLRYLRNNIGYVFAAFGMILLISIALRVLLGEGRSSGGDENKDQSEKERWRRRPKNLHALA